MLAIDTSCMHAGMHALTSDDVSSRDHIHLLLNPVTSICAFKFCSRSAWCQHYVPDQRRPLFGEQASSFLETFIHDSLQSSQRRLLQRYFHHSAHMSTDTRHTKPKAENEHISIGRTKDCIGTQTVFDTETGFFVSRPSAAAQHQAPLMLVDQLRLCRGGANLSP